jgi:hypothetical protein
MEFAVLQRPAVRLSEPILDFFLVQLFSSHRTLHSPQYAAVKTLEQAPHGFKPRFALPALPNSFIVGDSF